jgi:DNA topoisomerase-1
VKHTVTLTDAQLARAVRRCQDLPGQALFQYRDEAGRVRTLTSADVNAYVRAIGGEAFTAKDFRTWAGTLAAAQALDRGEGARQHARGVPAVLCASRGAGGLCRRSHAAATGGEPAETRAGPDAV